MARRRPALTDEAARKVHISSKWEAAGAKIFDRRLRTILVIGGSAVGETSFYHYLAGALLARQAEVAFVDADQPKQSWSADRGYVGLSTEPVDFSVMSPSGSLLCRQQPIWELLVTGHRDRSPGARRAVARNLLVLDGAPNHRCADLALPNIVSLLFLPPYAPELNPKKNLWDEISEKSSRIAPSNRSKQRAANLKRRFSTSSATPISLSPSLPSLISSSHPDLDWDRQKVDDMHRDGTLSDCRQQDCQHQRHDDAPMSEILLFSHACTIES